MEKLDYGLELTNNSKVGWAFSLPRTETCIKATALCKKLCYGNGIRYQSLGQKDKRGRNYRTSQFLLAEGGAEFWQKIFQCSLIKRGLRDWLAARIAGVATLILWTMRVHDIGDFYSVEYVKAWALTARKHRECKF